MCLAMLQIIIIIIIIFFLQFPSCHSDEKGSNKKLAACIAQGQTCLKMTRSLMWPTGLKEWSCSFKWFFYFILQSFWEVSITGCLFAPGEEQQIFHFVEWGMRLRGFLFHFKKIGNTLRFTFKGFIDSNDWSGPGIGAVLKRKHRKFQPSAILEILCTFKVCHNVFNLRHSCHSASRSWCETGTLTVWMKRAKIQKVLP